MSARSAKSTGAADREVATGPTSHGSGGNGKVAHLSVAERAARGKAARAEVPRRRCWASGCAPPGSPRSGRRCSRSRRATRVPELVPIRYGRMGVSPFTFYRGAAYLMAADLERGRRGSGLHCAAVRRCALSNFGEFASPDRRLVLDVNDFDETLPGPFDWDLKRLVASYAGSGTRPRVFRQGAACGQPGGDGRVSGGDARLSPSVKTFNVCYSRFDAETLIAQFQSTASAKRRKLMEENLAKTRSKNSLRAFDKLQNVDGEPRIVSDPPLIVPIEDLADGRDVKEFVRGVNRAYRRTLPCDRNHLLERFPLYPRGPQGRRGRQVGHPGVDHADARAGQRRSAVPAAQGGPAVGTRAVPRQEPVQPTPGGSSRASD